jgi:hypothetical protein
MTSDQVDDHSALQDRNIEGDLTHNVDLQFVSFTAS